VSIYRGVCSVSTFRGECCVYGAFLSVSARKAFWNLAGVEPVPSGLETSACQHIKVYVVCTGLF